MSNDVHPLALRDIMRDDAIPLSEATITVERVAAEIRRGLEKAGGDSVEIKRELDRVGGRDANASEATMHSSGMQWTG